MESKACSAAYYLCHHGQDEPQCIICEMGMITYVNYAEMISGRTSGEGNLKARGQN